MNYEAAILELQPLIEANERCPRFAAREERRAKLEEHEHREWLLACTTSCLGGAFGEEAQQAVRFVLDGGHTMRTDTASLEQAVREVRKIPPERRVRR